MKRPPDDEAALFRDSVRDVKRLRARDPPTGRKKPPARVRAAASAERPASAPVRAVAGDPLRFVRSGLRRARLRELRRGRLRAEAELDLHGLTAVRAERTLRDFLAAAAGRGLECVRIVHGKGLHSGSDGPVLKTLVESMLRGSPDVLAFTSAAQAHGGTGAVNVLLRKA